MNPYVTVLRWLARLSSLVIVGGFLAIAVGEMLSPQSNSPAKLVEWTGIILLCVACAGILLAWRWELPGAALSLAALAAFSVVIRMNRYTVLLVMAIPGILFAVDWVLRRSRFPTPTRLPH